MKKNIPTYSYSSGIGAGNSGCADGPQYLLDHLNILQSQGMVKPKQQTKGLASLPEIVRMCTELASFTAASTKNQELFLSLGGDHTMAIGTTSGVASALRAKGDVGLIWIDAHLDSHTPDTSESNNIHGMPVAHLLGYGNPALTHIGDDQPKIKPENVFFIGIRSYEAAELDFLKSHNVRIYFMSEVKARGLTEIIHEIAEKLRGAAGVVLSLDVDGIDPPFAPGTGVPEPDGIYLPELLDGLKLIKHEINLVGIEIAEFNPHLDVDNITLKTISKCIDALFEN